MSDFNSWFNGALADRAQDIVDHGCDGGFPGIIYYDECAQLYGQFEEEIYAALLEDAEDMGYENIEVMVSQFGRADLLDTPHGRKTLLLWYMVERSAREQVA